uniref:glucuronate isomerase n=1 Tax=Thaumasiovibrio occultus TaxID=1891184 RepID=UPI000B35638A|nr:glucuronate isomerase [Thaumasiovibrio occultus]
MKAFIRKDFLLTNDIGRELYHDYAKHQPIYDYHCHLNPADIANNRRFDNLTKLWLDGDHYKWRGMRTAGIEERLISSPDTTDYDKFLAWAKTVPQTLGNPLYHWAHLELKRPFGIKNLLLSPETAPDIWRECNAKLTKPEFSARGLIQQMNVAMLATTDDPVDSLEHHATLAKDVGFGVEVRPTWCPDKLIKIEKDGFGDYIGKLSRSADTYIVGFKSLLGALEKRLEHFAAHGCLAADHTLEVVRYAPVPSTSALDRILNHRLRGDELTELEKAQFSTAVQVWLAQQYVRLGWVMQLHIGAQSNNNSRMFAHLGAAAGFDSIGDRNYSRELANLLDTMDRTDHLPKTILYCLNPRDNEMIASMAGNFQGGGVASKIQFGAGWWFNDHKKGMTRQLEQISQLGLLSQFVGMPTDSNSFLAFSRHEYFRRILCNMIGGWAEDGEVPRDIKLLGNMVSNICFHNAKNYFEGN